MARRRVSARSVPPTSTVEMWFDSKGLHVAAKPQGNRAPKYQLKGENEHEIQSRILRALGSQCTAIRKDKSGAEKLAKINLFRSPDGMFWRNNSGVAKTTHGSPIAFGCPGSGDILGVYRGRPVAIEVKTEVGRQSKQQKDWQAAWESYGGVYILARSPGEVAERLSAL